MTTGADLPPEINPTGYSLITHDDQVSGFVYLFRGWVAGCEDDDLDNSAPTSFSVVGGYVRAQYEPSDASLLEVRGPLIHLILSFSHSLILILVLVLISRSSPSHLAEPHSIVPSPLRRRSAAALELPASYGGDDWRRSYVLYANGFDASGAAPAAGTFALHHPGGAVMKISFDDDAPTSSAGCTYTTAGTHWQVVLIGLRQRRFSCRRHPLVSGSPKPSIIIVIVFSSSFFSSAVSRFLQISLDQYPRGGCNQHSVPPLDRSTSGTRGRT